MHVQITVRTNSWMTMSTCPPQDACVKICMYVCMYSWMRAYVYMYACMHLCIYTYARAHTYATFTNVRVWCTNTKQSPRSHIITSCSAVSPVLVVKFASAPLSMSIWAMLDFPAPAARCNGVAPPCGYARTFTLLHVCISAWMEPNQMARCVCMCAIVSMHLCSRYACWHIRHTLDAYQMHTKHIWENTLYTY
jgi:hypothetical protein